jgi:hypothetical protein
VIARVRAENSRETDLVGVLPTDAPAHVVSRAREYQISGTHT